MFVLLIFINLFYFIFLFEASSLKVIYFSKNKKLYYVNGVNNDNNDLFLEFWGEEYKARYFIGINETTGEDIDFSGEKIKQIETDLNLIFHESIVINKNNGISIFSMNSYYFEFIDLINSTYNRISVDDIVDYETKGYPAMQNSMIKLKNNNYLLSSVIYKSTWGYKHHKHFMLHFNFNSSDIYNSFTQIKKVDIIIDYINSTSCFQTDNSYIQCSYNRVLALNDVFAIGIFNLDLEEQKYVDICSSIEESSFTKIFHLFKNTGAYIYFDRETNLPNIKIKNLNEEPNLENAFEFESIILNENGKNTSFNDRIFYSDGMKINENKFVVILTMNNLLELLICVFDLYNNKKSLRLRYFELELNSIDIKIGVNIRGIKFGNFFGIIFYNSNNEYPGYNLFNFPNFNTENNYINNTKIEIKLFINSTSYSLSFEEIELSNNICGDSIDGIEIVNFTDTSLTGVKINSSKLNSELYVEEELDIDDELILYPSETGAIPGKYILYFSPIIKEPNKTLAESFSDLTLYYGNVTQNDYVPQRYKGNVFILYYEIECHEKCKACSQLGSESNYYCVKCSDEYPYLINNGEKCENECNDYIYVKGENKHCIVKCYDDQYIYVKNENEKYCIEKCNEGQFIYVENQNEKYCLDNCNETQFKYFLNEIEKYCLLTCIFNNNELYSEDENKLCYNNCSEDTHGNIFTYENKCVSDCPLEYIPSSDNVCIKKQDINPTTLIENSLADTTEVSQQITIVSDKAETLESTIIFTNIYSSILYDNEENIIKSSLIDNTESNIESSLIDKEESNTELSLIDNTEKNIESTLMISDITSEINPNNNDIISTSIKLSSIISVIENNSEKESTENVNNEINPIIQNYITNGNYSELEVIFNDDTIISLYSIQSDLDSLIKINPNLTYVNINDCKNLLILENELDENSELLILGMETRNNMENSAYNNYTYEIYTTSGEKIEDLSTCENSNIEISYSVSSLDLINYQEALILSEQGYDIYNLSSSFYYDICLSANINGSDLTLSIRQQEIYPNVSLCQNDCSYNGFDLENKRVNCICNGEETTKNEDFKEEVDQNFFIYLVDMINYQIITCYKNLFDIKNFYNNFGFYIGFGLILIIFTLMVVFVSCGRNVIERQFLHKEPKEIEVKQIERNFSKNFQSTYVNYNKKKSVKKFRKRSKSYKKRRKESVNNLISNPIKKKYKKRKTSQKKRPKTSVDINLKFSGDYISSKPNFYLGVNNENYKRKSFSNVIINTSSNNKNLGNDEYNELSYNDAFEKDKRNSVKIFLSYFYVKLKTIQIMLYKKEFSHISITLSFYLFEILLDLTINSLLFSDEVISQKYYNNGELLFITTNILSISSNIISYFILLYTEKLINNNLILEEISKQIKESKEYYLIYVKILCCLKLKIAIFYFIILFIGLFCTYYLFVFCAIYKKIQKNLFINYILGSMWSLGFTVFICLSVTITRKIAIKYKIKRLYIISKFIGDKF